MSERAIGIELDRFAVYGDFGLRVGSAIEDDLGVDMHEELALGKAE